MPKRKRIQKAGNATINQVAVDPVLTNMSVSYTQDTQAFAHHRIFPVLPVDVEKGSYFVFNKSDIFRTDAQKRSPGTPANRKAISLSKQTFECEQWALDMSLPKELRASKDSPLADDQAVVEQLTLDLLMRREMEFASTYLATSVWGTDVVGTTDFVKFDAGSAVTIIENFRAWIRSVHRSCGRKPNKALISADVWDVIQDEAGVVNRQIYVSDKPVSTDWFASMIGIDEVIVPEGIRNTAAEGDAFVGSDIISNTCGIFYAEPSPAKMRPSAGYTFSWSEFDEVRAEVAGSGAAAIKQWWDENTESDLFRGKSHYDFGVVAPDCGLLATAVIN